jgi:hypothetical protein
VVQIAEIIVVIVEAQRASLSPPVDNVTAVTLAAVQQVGVRVNVFGNFAEQQ